MAKDKIQLIRNEVVVQLLREQIDVESLYVPIAFPDTQEYMHENWFENEAILDVDSKIGDSTYFIPLHRITNIKI